MKHFFGGERFPDLLCFDGSRESPMRAYRKEFLNIQIFKGTKNCYFKARNFCNFSSFFNKDNPDKEGLSEKI